jgi:hypothetical protein
VADSVKTKHGEYFTGVANMPEGYGWDERVLHYGLLMQNDPRESWKRKPGYIVFTRGEAESNKGAFICVKKAELEGIWAAERERMSRWYFHCGSVSLEPDTRSRLVKTRDRMRRWSSRWFSRFRDAWLCLAHGWEAEDPDSRDY